MPSFSDGHIRVSDIFLANPNVLPGEKTTILVFYERLALTTTRDYYLGLFMNGKLHQSFTLTPGVGIGGSPGMISPKTRAAAETGLWEYPGGKITFTACVYYQNVPSNLVENESCKSIFFENSAKSTIRAEPTISDVISFKPASSYYVSSDTSLKIENMTFQLPPELSKYIRPDGIGYGFTHQIKCDDSVPIHDQPDECKPEYVSEYRNARISHYFINQIDQMLIDQNDDLIVSLLTGNCYGYDDCIHIMKFDINGKSLKKILNYPHSSSPRQLTLDKKNNLYALTGSDVLKYDSEGTLIEKWVLDEHRPDVTGTPKLPRTNYNSIFIDSSSNIYLIDERILGTGRGVVDVFDSNMNYLGTVKKPTQSEDQSKKVLENRDTGIMPPLEWFKTSIREDYFSRGELMSMIVSAHDPPPSLAYARKQSSSDFWNPTYVLTNDCTPQEQSKRICQTYTPHTIQIDSKGYLYVFIKEPWQFKSVLLRLNHMPESLLSSKIPVKEKYGDDWMLVDSKDEEEYLQLSDDAIMLEQKFKGKGNYDGTELMILVIKYPNTEQAKKEYNFYVEQISATILGIVKAKEPIEFPQSPYGSSSECFGIQTGEHSELQTLVQCWKNDYVYLVSFTPSLPTFKELSLDIAREISNRISHDSVQNDRDEDGDDKTDTITTMLDPSTSITYVVPSWIKNNAKWWSQGTVSDSDFVQGIQYLIKEKIIEIPEKKSASAQSSQQIPSWVKNSAGWWADGNISDDDFVKGIQYLVEHGIIRV